MRVISGFLILFITGVFGILAGDAPVISGALQAEVEFDLRQPLEPVNRKVLGVCMLHTEFTEKLASDMKSFLDGGSVRVWLHLGYDQKYMQNIMNTVRQSGAREIFSFVPLCQMPNLVARYDSEKDNNLVRDQQTPAYLANMIGFLNKKAQIGFPGGYGLNILEVWNEPEYPQNGAWPAEDYARYALDVSRRVREKDPTMQIGVCVRPERNWPGWNRQMLIKVAETDPEAVNALISHPYDFFWIRAADNIGRYWAVVGGMENHRKQLRDYLDLAYEIGHGRWRLALTEWNTHPPSYKPPTNVSRDLPAAINMATAIQMFWELGVDSAHYFLAHAKQRDDGTIPHFALINTMKDGSINYNPTYKVLKLLGQTARGTRVRSYVKAPYYGYPLVKDGIINKIPLVTATAIFDFKVGELKVIMVNRHASATMPLSMLLNNFQPTQKEGELEVLSGATPEAEQASTTTIKVAVAEKFDGKLSLQLPPHSVSVLRIKGIRPLTEQERVTKLLNIIRDWHVCGVFPTVKDSRHGLDTKLPCEGKAIDLTEKYVGFENQQISWQKMQANAGGYVDLTAPLRILGLDQKIVEGLQGYAVSYLYSPKQQELTFSLGADYWALLRVNGILAVDMSKNPGGQPAPDRVRGRVKVNKGWNKLEVRLASGSKGIGFWLGVENTGKVVTSPSLTQPLKPPAEELSLKAVAGTFVGSWKENTAKDLSEVKWIEVSANPSTRRYGYLRWELPAGIKSADIEQARIRLVQKFQKNNGEVLIGPVLKIWSEKEVKWTTRPESGAGFDEKVKVSDGVWEFSGGQLLGLVRQWADDPLKNFGVYIKMSDKDFNSYAGFISEDNEKDYPQLLLKLNKK